MMKRIFWRTGWMVWLVPAALAAGEKPNVLFLLVDDLKPAIGAYGDELAVTPNLDRLAARGLRFDLAYCNQSVCAASRNAMMLGSRCTSIGNYSLWRNFRRDLPEAVTLTQHFMAHGYRAEGIGKIYHTGHGNVDDAASWSVPWHSEPVVEYLLPESTQGGKLTREEAMFTNRKLKQTGKLPRGAAIEMADVEDEAYADGRIASEGIRRLRAARERDEPFFLALGFVKPHLPFTAPKRYFDLHDPAKFQLAANPGPPEGAPEYVAKRGGEITNYFPVPEDGEVGADLARELIHGYYAATSYADAQIGRVLDELDRLELSEKTIVVLWGDHGWHLGDHGVWTKHTNYEQANRIPLIIVVPGVTTPGTATRQLAESVDVYPTLAALAGLPAPKGPQPMDGLDLTPVLKDPESRVRAYAYHCWPKEKRMGRAIRTERYRLVEWKVPGEPGETADLELYDYVEDPLERRNLAGERPEVVKRLMGYLDQQAEAVMR